MTETVQEQMDMLQAAKDDMDAFRSKVRGLSQELAETEGKLLDARSELAKSEELRKKAETCILDLRKEAETLSRELDHLRGATQKSVVDVGCQMQPTAAIKSTEGAATRSTGSSDWTMEVGTSSATQSVADSVRAVAEATATRTGFVLDQTSGMYYDCNSGYYYDQVNKLYYDPNTGIYYYFDEGTAKYQFHSQVERPAPAHARQGHRGKGRGAVSGKRKERWAEEEPRAPDDGRREAFEDMDCEIIEIRQDARHQHKRCRQDASWDHAQNLSERDSNAASRRARREKQLRKEQRTYSHGDVGEGVEVVTGEHVRQPKKRMQSREWRRKQHQESRSRRRKEKSADKVGKKEEDHSYARGQQNVETMDVVSDGEIGTDEAAEIGSIEGGGSQSQQNNDRVDGSENRAIGKENDDNQERLHKKSNETETVQKQKEGTKDETSPETIRGSSEGSTARDDSQSGEEARTDEDKGGGQRSFEEAADGGNHLVIVPNPDAEVRKSRRDKHLKDGRRGNPRKSGQTQKGCSDGEVIEDVMIIEDGEELIILSSDGMEEGELSDSMSDVSSSEGSSLDWESEPFKDDLEEVWVDSDNSGCVEVLKVDYPPCIRMIVTKSDTLKPGSLYIVTCSGGTIGREGSSHVILVQSVKVSKRHAQIMYDSEERQYTIVDLGSQNGTLLNGKAISEQRVVSKPYPLSHRDYITIGGTTLRLHIHSGDETCEECEPGQVQALIALQQLNELSAGTTSGSKQDKETQRRKELRHLKKKFNLAKDDYINQDPSLTNPAYGDRAGERRRTVGSDNPYQLDDQPASVDKAIGSTNLGHKLLSKLGWSEGQSLGKGDRGIKEPIQAVVHSRNAGLGSGNVQSLDQVQYSRRKNENWGKARGRYNLVNPPQPGSIINRGKKGLMWIQGGTQKPDASLPEPSSDNPSGANVFDVVQLPLAGRGKGEAHHVMSEDIVEIWDESMETENSIHQDDSGLFPAEDLEKETGKSADGRGKSAGKDSTRKRGNLRGNSEEHEILFLGKETSERNSEGRSSVLQTAESSSNDGKFVKGSKFKSRKSGARQFRARIEDIFPDSSVTGQNVEGIDDARQSEQEELRNVNEDRSQTAEFIAEPLSDEAHADSESKAAQERAEEKSESISRNPLAVEETGEQNKETQENLDKTEESESLMSQKPDRNQGTSANESRMGNSEALAIQSNSEAAGTSSDKGKIQLKWNKGGKERLVTNLVAFEESESEDEATEITGNK